MKKKDGKKEIGIFMNENSSIFSTKRVVGSKRKLYTQVIKIACYVNSSSMA